jgi:hypothetical protein
MVCEISLELVKCSHENVIEYLSGIVPLSLRLRHSMSPWSDLVWQACREPGISEETYYRWRRRTAG